MRARKVYRSARRVYEATVLQCDTRATAALLCYTKAYRAARAALRVKECQEARGAIAARR